MAEQLPLDFTASATVRHRRAVKAAAAEDQPTLFASWSPNLDIHLHTPAEAIAQITGPEPERAHHWLAGIVGSVRVLKTRRVAFPTASLDRLLHIRPPAQISLDAACVAVGRGLWAHKLDLKPLRVTRERQRLIAASPRWPTGFGVKDVPWTAIAALTHLGVPLDVEPRARTLFNKKLSEAGTKIAVAGLAGSAVIIEARQPTIVENLGLPALAYSGEQGTGRYKLPLLCAEPLLRQNVIDIPPDLEAAIRKATGKVKPLTDLPESFPWTLYPFQARDAGQAERILETTGGVLLAGDMGSGKTTVSLALVEHLGIWPLLVVAPLSAFSTWARQLGELGRSHYLATETPSKSWEAIEHGGHDAVVISYDRLPAFVELIERMQFRGIVADELQRIRTPGSKRSRALRALASSVPMRIGLSGTPLSNYLTDLLPQGAFLAPGEWKPRASSKDLEDLYPGDPVEAVAEHLGALMVRRRMEDTGAKLPNRNDHRVHITLTPEQRRALAELEAEAEAAKENGEFDDPSSKMHAFVRLQRMRQIVNSPSAAGVAGPNPKVIAAVELAEDFLAAGRKGVIFTADRTSFREIGKALDEAGIGWVGIWGATPPAQRIENERRFHTDPDVKVVLCTIQAGSESWSASPTATWLISTAYVYTPATLSQMEARVYRLNSKVDGPAIEICYVHAQAPGGSLDDRMVEILEVKKELFAQVVDRRTHVDTTKVHMSMADLVYLLTGKHDEKLAKRETDAKATQAREQAKKDHARGSAHKHKQRNKDFIADDGATALTLEQYRAAAAGDGDPDLDELLAAADADETGALGLLDDED